ncbi:MAG TPA: hypothetical protein DCZ10_15830 [Pelotomaculum sp.]|nr:hypothetical protein [Pelotomaculum sp.]
MADKSNVLWEKHRMYLPDMRQKAVHRCKHCKFFVPIKGKTEVKYGCVVSIKAYGNMEKRIPPVVPVMEIVKLIGLEGLQDALKGGDPETQSCGRFELKPK